MTPGSRRFAGVPPQRQPRRAAANTDYEYKTVRIKNRWSRNRQDREINRLAEQGWELMQRSPQGGLLGGGVDVATFRRRRRRQIPQAQGWREQLRDLLGR